LAVALVVGCAGYTSAMRPDDEAARDSTYLYGRFFVKADRALLGMDGYQTMGLVMRCADGRTYTIRFSNKRGVQVIKASPSRCWLTELVYTDVDGFVKGRAPAPRSWTRPQSFSAGRAYYLGDYFGKAERKPIFLGAELTWAMDAGGDDYDETTTEMKRTFPSLARLQTEDSRLAPAEPKFEGEGTGAPLPPGEVPLSAERTRGLAPFIKRTFASSAACRAACPTGHCLPFRGEAGVAVTCVVRCEADKDCPAGLACNCPNSDGPECHLVARTALDPMDGFCLSVEPGGPRR